MRVRYIAGRFFFSFFSPNATYFYSPVPFFEDIPTSSFVPSSLLVFHLPHLCSLSPFNSFLPFPSTDRPPKVPSSLRGLLYQNLLVHKTIHSLMAEFAATGPVSIHIVRDCGKNLLSPRIAALTSRFSSFCRSKTSLWIFLLFNLFFFFSFPIVNMIDTCGWGSNVQ